MWPQPELGFKLQTGPAVLALSSFTEVSSESLKAQIQSEAAKRNAAEAPLPSRADVTELAVTLRTTVCKIEQQL